MCVLIYHLLTFYVFSTRDGFENHWATNHLGPFLLTHLLLDKLRESRGRVVGTI